jgi:hypothetical protein
MAKPSANELHRALVDRLVDEAAPVRRLWPVWARLVVWWVLVVVAALVVRRFEVARYDFTDRLADVAYLAELLCLATAATLLAHRALVGAVPGREPRRGTLWLVVALIGLGLALASLAGARTGVRMGEFADTGLRCLVETTLAALLPWIALMIATRRGAPMRVASVGATAGAASWLMAWVVMRIRCPFEDVLHMMTWHGLPVVAGTLVSTILGVILLAGWRRPPAAGR